MKWPHKPRRKERETNKASIQYISAQSKNRQLGVQKTPALGLLNTTTIELNDESLNSLNE